jgi:drug/metabolite transporter (DMT)-like permease
MGGCGEAGSAAGGGDGGSLWWFGVLLSVVSSILSNLGVNTQKLSLMREAKRASERRRSYVKQPLWQIGLLLVIVGSLGDFAALGFAAQSLVTPVGAVTMVANLFFASLWLGENLSKSDVGATGLILAGAVTAAAFADKSEQCYTLDQLVELYARPAFLVYAGGVVLVSVFFFLVSRRCESLKERHGVDSSEYAHYKKIHPFCYALLSGMLGAQSVLFAKSTAELFEMSLSGDFQFHKPVSWVILAAMLCCIFSQLHWMAKGLEQFDALYIVPVFQCFFITVAILGGGVYFEELSNFDTLQAVMFPTGVLLTIIGVFILTQRDDSTEAADAVVEVEVKDEKYEEGSTTTMMMAMREEGNTRGDGGGGNLHRARSMSALDAGGGRRDSSGGGGGVSSSMHVSQMSLRPSLALSVVGSVGSLSQSLKAALKAAGEKADRAEGGAAQVGGPPAARLVDSGGGGGAHGRSLRAHASESDVTRFARQREEALAAEASALRAPGAPPLSRSSGASLRNGNSHAGGGGGGGSISGSASGFMSLHSLNENSIPSGLKVRGASMSTTVLSRCRRCRCYSTWVARVLLTRWRRVRALVARRPR